mgnify:CR=1 FL=1
MTYEKAIAQLEEIVTSIESGTLNLDKLTGQLQKAKELIAFCRDALHTTGEEVDKLLEEEQ